MGTGLEKDVPGKTPSVASLLSCRLRCLSQIPLGTSPLLPSWRPPPPNFLAGDPQDPDPAEASPLFPNSVVMGKKRRRWPASVARCLLWNMATQ